MSLCTAELRRRAGVYRSVLTRRAGSADDSLTMITRASVDVVGEIAVLVIRERCEADRRLRINYPWRVRPGVDFV